MGDLTGFSSLEKYQLPLNLQPFPTAFQADDEGSIPFTRSNLFNDLGGSGPAIAERVNDFETAQCGI